MESHQLAYEEATLTILKRVVCTTFNAFQHCAITLQSLR